MSVKTPTIRVSSSTLARMKAEIHRILSAVEAGQRTDPGTLSEAINPLTLGLTYDQLINLMLDQREGHRARDRKARAKKRGEGNVEQK